MSAARHGLRRRLVAAFALFALGTALCFSLFAVLFVYSVEDDFFERLLAQEAAHQRSTWAASARTPAPLRPFVSVHHKRSSFPADLAGAMPAAATAGEFAGADGRHYHVRQVLRSGSAPVFLVAEVSKELVVRPRLPYILGFLGVSTLVILAITLALGYWLARRATEPLTRLTSLVSGAIPGRLPQGFAADFPENEIGELARTLEQALDRIAGFIEREQHFTRDASHELRTPLAVIDGAAALLARHAMPPQAAAQLQRIRNACAQMAHTVEALLALAREELRRDDGGEVHLLPLVESTVVQFAHLLDGKQVEVIVDLPTAMRVRTHPGALAILLANLVGNAFAHTRQGRVRIGAEGSDLVIEDSGPGVAPDVRQRMFEAGTKGEDSSGFGLGLSIASRLAARLEIGLAIGDAPGGGTRAVLRWPIAT
ncbi:MAG: HAMP domain-containing sensor histidine kinase [Pseudomonadota bacterium]